MVAQARDFSAMKLFAKPIPPEQVEFAAWSDASFAAQWKSQGGYMVCATDARLRRDEWAELSPLRWRSYKQDRQVASTLGAELMTLSRTISETKWIRSIWAEAIQANYKLEEDQIWTSRIPVTVAVDSRPVFDHLNGQLMTTKDKRLAIEMLLVKRDVAKDGISIMWLPTDHMLVDGLTKMNAKMDFLRKPNNPTMDWESQEMNLIGASFAFFGWCVCWWW